MDTPLPKLDETRMKKIKKGFLMTIQKLVGRGSYEQDEALRVKIKDYTEQKPGSVYQVNLHLATGRS